VDPMYSSQNHQKIIQTHASQPNLRIPKVQAQSDEAYADGELRPCFGDEASCGLHIDSRSKETWKVECSQGELTDTVWRVRSVVGVSRDRSFKSSSFICDPSFLIHQRPSQCRCGYRFISDGRNGGVRCCLPWRFQTHIMFRG
jgi:hypothetical protein